MGLAHFGGDAQSTARALALASALLDGPQRQMVERREPLAYSAARICGVGLFYAQGRCWPAVIQEDYDAPNQLESRSAEGVLPVLRELAGMVYRDRGVDWLLDGLRLVPVLPCRAQAGLGDAIAVGGIDGQLGAPVRWSAGQGYLTAGHVGQALGTMAFDAFGGPLGHVVQVRNPPPGGGGRHIDVAVIEVPASMTIGSVRASSAQANDAIVVQTRKGPQLTNVLAYCTFFYASLSAVTLADVYLSANGVTQGGDSGGPAWLGRRHEELVGHVVAGGPNTSCVQDVQQQIAKIRSDPGFASLSL